MPARSEAEHSFKRLPPHHDRVDSFHKLRKPQVIALGDGYVAQPVQTTIWSGYVTIKTCSDVYDVAH